MSRCRYCGNSVSAGGACSKSPIKTHVVEIPGKCIYCGNKVSAGGLCGLCSNSPLMQISSLWAGGIGRHVTQ
jgi:hypothetical protein